jgi:hypothetical protein
MGIRYTDKKWMELGTLGPLPSDLQALLPYHRVECAETEFFSLTRDCAVLNFAELGTSLMTVQEHCRPLYGEQFHGKKRLVKCSWLTYAVS